MNIEDIEEAIYEQTQEFVPQCVYKAILNLIAAERDACAKACEDVHAGKYEALEFWREGVAYTCAAAIRARSKS
jgi:rRNA-processing protein FCF1